MKVFPDIPLRDAKAAVFCDRWKAARDARAAGDRPMPPTVLRACTRLSAIYGEDGGRELVERLGRKIMALAGTVLVLDVEMAEHAVCAAARITRAGDFTIDQVIRLTVRQQRFAAMLPVAGGVDHG